MGKHVFCHFSFRKPKSSDVGIFCVLFSGDYEGKKPAVIKVSELELWNDRQHINAIQSYSNALYWIWKRQKDMKASGIDHVYLVSGNSTLLKWLNDMPKKSEYYDYMTRARRGYMFGDKKEIEIPIGLAECIEKEPGYKYCKDECVNVRLKRYKKGPNKLNIGGVSIADLSYEDTGIDVTMN